MSQLEDLIPSLKNAVAPPGEFDTLYPESDDGDLLVRLLDAFGEAQLDGYLSDHATDDDGLTTPDLTRAQAALVILYGAKRVLDMRLLTLKTHVRYEAGTAVFEQDQGASTLTQLQKDFSVRLKELRDYAREASYDSGFYMADLYITRAVAHYSGFAELGYDDGHPHLLDAIGGL